MSFLDLKPYMSDLIYENISGVKRVGNQLVFRCPICGDGKKLTSKRGHFYLDTGSYYCFNGGCDANETGMSGLMFLSKILNISINDVKKELIKRAGSMHNIINEFQEEQHKIKYNKGNEGLISEKILDGIFTEELPTFVKDIIIKRKLDKAIFPKWFKFYFDKEEERLVIPWNNDYYQERAITYDQEKDAKYKFPFNVEKPLFGLENIDNNFKYIFLVEGVFDSVWVKNGIAVGSLTLSSHQKNSLEIYKNNGFEIILLMDNQLMDNSSKEKTLKILTNEPFTKIFIWPKQLERFKDINDTIIYSDKMIDIWKNELFLVGNIANGIKGRIKLENEL